MLLHSTQLWVVIISAVVPLLSYALNYLGPHVSEQAKAVVHVLVAAVAAAIYQAVQVGHLGFNNLTAQDILTGVVAALAAHHLLWKPSGIGALFGAGRNAPKAPVNPA